MSASQSNPITASVGSKPIEIQVRTKLQHLWAQLSGRFSDSLDPSLKYGGGDPVAKKMLSRLSNLISIEDLELGTGALFRVEDSVRLTPKLSALQKEVARQKQDLAQHKQELRELLEDMIAADPQSLIEE